MAKPPSKKRSPDNSGPYLLNSLLSGSYLKTSCQINYTFPPLSGKVPRRQHLMLFSFPVKCAYQHDRRHQYYRHRVSGQISRACKKDQNGKERKRHRSDLFYAVLFKHCQKAEYSQPSIKGWHKDKADDRYVLNQQKQFSYYLIQLPACKIRLYIQFICFIDSAYKTSEDRKIFPCYVEEFLTCIQRSSKIHSRMLHQHREPSLIIALQLFIRRCLAKSQFYRICKLRIIHFSQSVIVEHF